MIYLFRIAIKEPWDSRIIYDRRKFIYRMNNGDYYTNVCVGERDGQYVCYDSGAITKYLMER